MPNHTKHSRQTRCLVTYLHNFCRGTGKINNRGFFRDKDIERLTGVPASTVNKIARGVL